MSPSITKKDLEQAYQAANAGNGKPNLVVVPYIVLKQHCFAIGTVAWWLKFLRDALADPEKMAANRMNPARLPE
jgi:hypothetical protein